MRRFVRWPTLFVLIALIMVAIVPAVLSIRHVTGAYASGGAKITLSSSTGQPGATIQVSGTGFTPGQSVSLYLGSASSTLLTFATIDTSGNLPFTNITVPDQPGGANTITAVQGKLIAQAAFSIEPLISLSKTDISPGEVTTLTAKGFASNSVVQLYFDTISGQSDMYFDSNSNGDYTSRFTLPFYFLIGGQHILIAVGNNSGVPLQAQTNITIRPYIFPMAGQPGSQESLNGLGFTANETVSIYWGYSTGQLLGSTTTGTSGDLYFDFTVPSGLANGSYPVTIVRAQHRPPIITMYLHISSLTLAINPVSIQSGQRVLVNLTGFLANETVKLNWNADGGGPPLTTFTTDRKGSVNSAFIPRSATPGMYTVTASDASGLQATSTLNINPGISVASGDPGTTIPVSGGGFSANETLNVYLQTPANGVVTATTNAIGAFYVDLPLPGSYNQSGRYYLHAVSTTNIEYALTRFRFSTPTFAACNISNTCDELLYGDTVYFDGDHFATNETVDIIWNYQQPGQFLLAKAQCFFNSFSLGKSIPAIPGQGAITIAAIGETSHIIVTNTLIVDAAISDNVYNASAGTNVDVNGGGFGAGDTITLSLSGKTVATTTSASDGTFATTFLVPAISGPDNLTLTATDTTANVTASLPFDYTPAITVNPNVVQNGNSVTVTGKHFSANAQILVFGNSNQYVTANANGSFSATVVLSGYQPGSYNLTVEDMSTSIQVSAQFVVQ